MSTNWELENNTLEVSPSSETTVSPAQDTVSVVDTEKDVTVVRKQYSIIGDQFYASMTSEDAPQWLRSIIDSVVLAEISGSLTDLQNANQSIIQALDEIDIAKNQYQELINIESTIDSIISSRLETLNASIDSNSASILSLESTKVTESEATAIALNQISSELNDRGISASILSLESTKVTESEATAIALNQISSEINGGAIGAEITSINLALSDTNSALASTTDTLTASFNDLTNAQSTLENTVYTNASKAEANFAYNATVTLGGVEYSTGFGLATEINDTTIPTGTSEFWVQAEKFRVIGTDSVGGEVDNAIFAINTSTGLVSIGTEFTEATRNEFRGEWDITLTYLVGDIVTFNGSSFVATQESTGIEVSNDTYWSLLAGQGQGQVMGISFLRSATKPSTPVGGSFENPTATGWSDGIPVEDGNPCWYTTRWFTSDGASPQQSTWSEPSELSNTSFTEYEYSTDAATWQSTPFDGAVYARLRSKENGIWTAWSSPYRIKGEDGTNGTDGERGPGTVTASSTYTSTPSDSTLTTEFKNRSGYTYLVSGDSVVYSVSGTGGGTFTAVWTGSSWLTNVQLYVNGDAIIDGTLNANKLDADISISTNGYIVADGNYNSSFGNGAIVGNTSDISTNGVIGYSSNTTGAGVRGQTSNGTGVTGVATGTSGGGVRGVAGGGGSGVYGYSGTGYAGEFDGDVLVIGAVNPFTASHEGITNVSDLVPGDIVTDTEFVASSDINNALFKTVKSTYLDKAVGVYVASSKKVPYVLRALESPIQTGYRGIVFNSVGEGMINVCGEGGNFSNGDLIQCSHTQGKGMRQNKEDGTPDDVVKNITIAKVRGNHSFTDINEVKQVPCIYLCG